MVSPVQPLREGPPEANLGKRGITNRQGSSATQRWNLLTTARRITTRKSLRTCGLFTAEGRVSVSLTEKGHASVSGVHTCGSKLCPVCQAREAGAQMAKLERAATKLLEDGGSALFLTLTIPHDRGSDLGDLVTALQKAWSASMSGQGGKVWKRYGRTHYLRALDYTHGSNGHHPHYHAVIFMDGVVSDEDLYWLEFDLRTRWSRSVKKSTGRDCVHQAVHVKRSEGGATEVVRYAGKALTGMLLEAVWSQSKDLGGRTVWDVLRGAESSTRDQALWKELEAGFYRRRWLVCSQGLLDLGEESEELEDEDSDELERESLVELSSGFWRAINRAGVVGLFLSSCESHSTRPKRWKVWKELCDLSLEVMEPPDWPEWVEAALMASGAFRT
jgi:hypothetical protein